LILSVQIVKYLTAVNQLKVLFNAEYFDTKIAFVEAESICEEVVKVHIKLLFWHLTGVDLSNAKQVCSQI
jgi:hypothetical protein